MFLNPVLVLAAALALVPAAWAQPLPPPGSLGNSSGVATLFTYGNGTGLSNGADTTEDTLLTFNIPAGTLKAVGDRLRIYAAGSFASSTDAKNIRVRLNGSGAFQLVQGTTAATVSWNVYMEVQKTGSNAQQQASWSFSQGGASGVTTAAITLADTSPIALTVTGQNSTTATAGTATVKYVSVEYLP